MRKKVYLITADVYLLLQQWANENNFVLPPQAFFKKMHAAALSTLRSALGKNVKVVSLQAELLAENVAVIIQRMENVPVVAMDPLLFNIPTGSRPLLTFQSTRLSTYKSGQWDKLEEGPRPYFPSLKDQAQQIAKSIKKYSTNRVIVIDDGCYDGDSLKNCVQLLTKEGLQVVGAVVGVHRKKGLSQVFTCPFQAVHTYKETDLVDWICERDFFPGIPYGGRTILTNGEVATQFELAAYYLHNFGLVEKWASIPEDKTLDFSNAMLNISCLIFEEIQKTNQNQLVLTRHIKRWPMYRGQPLPRTTEKSFAQQLHELY